MFRTILALKLKMKKVLKEVWLSELWPSRHLYGGLWELVNMLLLCCYVVCYVSMKKPKMFKVLLWYCYYYCCLRSKYEWEMKELHIHNRDAPLLYLIMEYGIYLKWILGGQLTAKLNSNISNFLYTYYLKD